MDDLGVVDAAQIYRGDREVGVTELPLDDEQRDSFAAHFDGVGVAEPVWREPAAHAGCAGGIAQLDANPGGGAGAAAGGSTQHAEQRADRQPGADAEPWLELLPGPAVHSDFAALAALALAHQHCAACLVEIASLNRERFTDSQPCTPQQDNQPT